MKVEITIDRQKKLPDGAVPALEKELLRRLDQNFNNCSLVIRRAISDGLSTNRFRPWQPLTPAAAR